MIFFLALLKMLREMLRNIAFVIATDYYCITFK